MKYTLVSLNGADDSGGVERVTFYLKKILEKQGDVVLLTRTKLQIRKLDLVWQPFLIALRLFLFHRRSLVIANDWNSWFYPADLSIHHGTTAGVMERIPGEKRLGSRLIAMMERSSAKASKRILAVSESAKADLRRFYGIDSGKITVLHNFVDERIFFPKPIVVPPPSTIRIIFCGRLEVRKGVDVLKRLSDHIETLAGSDWDGAFSLCIASNSKENADLFQGNTHTVIRTGLRLADMREFYTGGDVLFFPSRYEGFSMSTLEALACGIPVVGTAEAIKDDLAAYDFTRIVDIDAPMDAVLQNITAVVRTWHDRADEIHRTIARDFGCAQYEARVLALLKETNTDFADSIPQK
ncbi:hypothetical protein FACS1894109_04350 [Spirochaetia bacterium]|nr:hypothetical protein FACS1894109_04350 [Spirochaetia bacterium]